MIYAARDFARVMFRPGQSNTFYPVTSRTLFRSQAARPCAILSHGGQRSRVNIRSPGNEANTGLLSHIRNNSDVPHI